MRNIRLLIAYDGTDFHGWQRQPNVPTIQACLESVIEKIIAQRVTLHGSGRTDAGVHALNQVANFKISGNIPPANLLKAMNNLLPSTIRVKKVEDVEDSFHARYDARAKTYRYRISMAPICSPFMVRYVHHYPYPLNLHAMAEGARNLEGEHDFSSFAGSAGDVQLSSTHRSGDKVDNTRTIFASRILWRPRTSILIYEARGNGFLHHMVRNIVGTLLEVGRGKLEPQEVLKILKARDRTRAGPTAPASGLCLMKVEYGAVRSLCPAHID